MSNPNLAILSNLGGSFITRATASPYAICLGTGLVGASYVAWGQGSTGGLMRRAERENAGVGREEALKVWAWAFHRGAKFGLPATILTALSFVGAAFQIPPSSFTQTPRQVRNFIFGIAGVWLLHGAYGAAILLPTSSRLLTLRKQLDARDSSLSPAYASEADALMQTWANWQWGRVVLGGLGWVGAVAAYLSI